VFIENFIAEVLKRLGYEVVELRGIITSTMRALRETLLRLSYGTGLFIVAFACGFIPLLALAPLICAAFFVGFDLIDLPLTLRGMQFRERWHFGRAHLIEVLGLGACFMAIMIIPLGGLLFFPVAYYVAAELLHWADK
jgi:uncharacterized protein involved in cysteine biosynthesis